MVAEEQERETGRIERDMPDELPDWVVDEIQNAEFTDITPVDGTGFVLEMYKADSKADIQLDVPMEDGRHIITVDVPDSIKYDTLEKGVAYQISLEQQKAPLSAKAVRFLHEEKELEMKAIYRFELRSLEKIDEDADI